MSGCDLDWASENSGSRDFEDPQPNSEIERLCCPFDVRDRSALGL